MEKIRDFSMLAVILAGCIIKEFANFNQFILILIVLIWGYTFLETMLRKRLESKEREELQSKISDLILLTSQQKSTLDKVQEYQKDLQEFRDSKYKDLVAATQMLYTIPEVGDSLEYFEECKKIIRECTEIYINTTDNKYNIVDIYDDVSSNTAIKHNIRELKRIKKDNDMGLKFNTFLEYRIQQLEVMLDVNSRINNKGVKSKPHTKGNHSKRKSRKRKHTL
jgi:hypothetical protein